MLLLVNVSTSSPASSDMDRPRVHSKLAEGKIVKIIVTNFAFLSIHPRHIPYTTRCMRAVMFRLLFDVQMFCSLLASSFQKRRLLLLVCQQFSLYDDTQSPSLSHSVRVILLSSALFPTHTHMYSFDMPYNNNMVRLRPTTCRRWCHSPRRQHISLHLNFCCTFLFPSWFAFFQFRQFYMFVLLFLVFHGLQSLVYCAPSQPQFSTKYSVSSLGRCVEQ